MVAQVRAPHPPVKGSIGIMGRQSTRVARSRSTVFLYASGCPGAEVVEQQPHLDASLGGGDQRVEERPVTSSHAVM